MTDFRRKVGALTKPLSHWREDPSSEPSSWECSVLLFRIDEWVSLRTHGFLSNVTIRSEWYSFHHRRTDMAILIGFSQRFLIGLLYLTTAGFLLFTGLFQPAKFSILARNISDSDKNKSRSAFGLAALVKPTNQVKNLCLVKNVL